MDRPWWDMHIDEVRATFAGQLAAPIRNCHDIESRRVRAGNSGAGALLLAASYGACRIVMLGYDVQHTGGHAHWHGNHPGKLGNAGRVADWPSQFATVAAQLPTVEIINCSRETALRVFQRAPLESVL